MGAGGFRPAERIRSGMLSLERVIVLGRIYRTPNDGAEDEKRSDACMSCMLVYVLPSI